MTNLGLNTQQKNLPTFLNMPMHVANHVLEKMEPMDLLKARKVCRSLRTAVDKFGFLFGYIHLSLMKNDVKMSMSDTGIMYTTTENGSTNVAHNGHEKLIDGETFVERALKDLKILSKHARKIVISNFSKDRHDIITTFVELFKSENCIHVEEIELRNFSFDEVLTILPCFGAKELKKIELVNIQSIDQFERITHLEQWENAEEVRMVGTKIPSTIIVHLFNFKFFGIYQMDEFPARTAIQIRDDLLKRSTFQSCEIYFEMSKSNPIEIAKVFKPDYAGGNVFKIEFSNGNDKFDISLQELSYGFLLNMKRSLSV